MGEVKEDHLGNSPSFFLLANLVARFEEDRLHRQRLNLWVRRYREAHAVKVDAHTRIPWRVLDPQWSPDSKWITYTKQLKTGLRLGVCVLVETGKSRQVTDGA